MAQNDTPAAARILFDRHLAGMIDLLQREGYHVIGPRLHAGSIVYDEIHGLEDLPVGWTNEQEAGVFRLKRRSDGALFGYQVGQESWKRLLHRSVVRLWAAQRKGRGYKLADLPEAEAPPMAFFGVRPCDLAAIKIQDVILMGDKVVDPLYRARRERVLLICVNCTQGGGTCFCASMGTGPAARSGFDLALTEVLEGGGHYFIAEPGSSRGAGLLDQLEAGGASAAQMQTARQLVSRAASQMGRTIETGDVRELLQENLEHPRWDEVARRCLTCGNCTMVCPTCFCTTVEDTTDLAGRHAERWRKWDVCYSLDFTYLYGGSVRASAKSRYRQWLTHKVSTWIDQFGMSGCVGCGRCITWCPVGIDLTEEVCAIRQTRSAPAE